MGIAPLGDVPALKLFPRPVTLTVRDLPGLAAVAGISASYL
jgi:hypothetical protein